MDPKEQITDSSWCPQRCISPSYCLQSLHWDRSSLGSAFTDCISLAVPSGRGRLCWWAAGGAAHSSRDLSCTVTWGSLSQEECSSCSMPCHSAVQGFSNGLFLLKMRNSSWVTFYPGSTCHSKSQGLNLPISFPNMTFYGLGVSRKARHGSSFCRLDAAGAGIEKTAPEMKTE